MNQLYAAIGISKQAVHKQLKQKSYFDANVFQLITKADELRKQHPGCGVEKMYYSLKPDFIGRDKFVSTFMSLGYRLKRKKNYHRTTIASLIYKPNLIKGLVIDAPCVVWQSDITYIQVGEKHCYAVFIIDVYTKEIVGFSVSDHMRATANIMALKMALKKWKSPQIHHSDRGSQYISKGYIQLLESNGTKISMGKSAQENAYAERINRTIKEEYIGHKWLRSIGQLRSIVTRAVLHYNQFRPHKNLGMLTPFDFILKWNKMKTEDRPKITIFDDRKV
jgi:transposase InsO family protein